MSTHHHVETHWDQMSDEELFVHAKAHPEEMAKQQAYFHLVQRHERSLYRHMLRALRDDPAQEDLAEQFFMKAWNELYHGDHPDVGNIQHSVSGKVFAIADVMLFKHFMQQVHPEKPDSAMLGNPQSALPPGGLPHAGRRGHSSH